MRKIELHPRRGKLLGVEKYSKTKLTTLHDKNIVIDTKNDWHLISKLIIGQIEHSA